MDLQDIPAAYHIPGGEMLKHYSRERAYIQGVHLDRVIQEGQNLQAVVTKIRQALTLSQCPKAARAQITLGG